MSKCTGAPHWVSMIAGLSLALGSIALVSQAATIGLNFTGVTLTDGQALNAGKGYAPPDSDGAVGPDRIVQLINGAYAVYDKSTGSRLELISGRQFWINAHIDPGTDLNGLGTFNARILYDPTVGRWIAAALSAQPTYNSVMIARSDTADPMGAWQAVSFLGNLNADNGTFADFTRLGVDANGIYVGTNNFVSNLPGGGGQVSSSLFSLPKADLMAASPVVTRLSRFDGVDTDMVGDSAQPIINFGPSQGRAPVLGNSITDPAFTLSRIDIVGVTTSSATMANAAVVNINAYKSPPPAAQPDGTRSISTIDSRITANVYQVGHTIYTVHATTDLSINNNSNSVIQWVIINELTNQVIQQGILRNPDFDYFQPSIAANANGDIVISFTRSGSGAGGNLSDYAAIGHTVGNVTTFGDPFLLKASTVDNYHYVIVDGHIVGDGRWGDYTTTQVDPSNPNVFWTFQEYALDTHVWATQITQINVPEPGSIVPAAVALAALSLAAWRTRRRPRAI